MRSDRARRCAYGTAPTRSPPVTSKTLIHPFTNLAEHAVGGAAGDRAGRGRLRLRPGRPALSRGHGGPVVHRARLQREAAGAGRRSSSSSGCRPTTCSAASRTRPAIELAERLLRMAPVPMARVHVRRLRLRGQRHRAQAGPLLPPRARPAREAQDHRPRARLSRRDAGLRQPDRAAASCTATSACRSRACCTPTARTTTASACPARPRSSSRCGWPATSSG